MAQATTPRKLVSAEAPPRRGRDAGACDAAVGVACRGDRAYRRRA
jgi:hypothetical protein